MTTNTFKMNHVFGILFFTYFAFAAISNDTLCDSNKCYQSVNKSYSNFRDVISRFNSTISSANIRKIYDLNELKNDLLEVKKIENEAKKIDVGQKIVSKTLNRSKEETNKNQKTVDNFLEKLSNVSKYNSSINNILEEAKKQNHKTENLVLLAQNASRTCQQSQSKYGEFLDLVNNLEKNYNNVFSTYNNTLARAANINKKVEDENKRTQDIKKDFDEIKLPLNVVEIFTSDSEGHLKEDLNLLKELLNDASSNEWLANYAKALMKNLSELQRNISQIDQALAEYQNTFIETYTYDPAIDAEVSELEKILNALEGQLDIDLTDLEYEDDQTNLEKFRQYNVLLKEHIALLDALPREKQLKEIRKEVNDFRVAVESAEEFQKLEEELGMIMNIAEEIQNVNCSMVTGLGS